MVDKQAPEFETDSYTDGNLGRVKLNDYKGKWVVLFFYPADYTFVCPTEIAGFADYYEKFKANNCEILAVSEDTAYVHKAWAASDPRIGKAKYPMLADRTGYIAKAYGVYNEKTGNAYRGLFIINPDGVIRYEVTTADDVGRSTEETFRVLCALQSGGLCPVDWHLGDATLKKA